MRIKPPNNIALNEYRYYKTGLFLYSVATFIHALLLFIFYIFEAPVLAAFNILSVFLFSSCVFLNRKGWFIAATSFAFFELTTHQVLCVIYIGWYSSFQYYLLLITVLPFAIAGRSRHLYKFSMSIICLAVFLFLDLRYADREILPIYSINPVILNIFHITGIITSISLIILSTHYYADTVLKVEDAIQSEYQKVDDLLYNMLPASIADRLKEKSGILADGFDSVTILFLDIVGFTKLSSQKSPEELVRLLNKIFHMLDDLSIKYELEKIKTIGDAYMVVAGIPKQRTNDAERIACFALDSIDELKKFNQLTKNNLNIRIGINSGPVVAGVIGKKKFTYDLWGDAVNIASKMQSYSLPGKIQVSDSTYELLTDKFNFEKREEISIKGKGMMQTYILKSQNQL